MYSEEWLDLGEVFNDESPTIFCSRISQINDFDCTHAEKSQLEMKFLPLVPSWWSLCLFPPFSLPLAFGLFLYINRLQIDLGKLWRFSLNPCLGIFHNFLNPASGRLVPKIDING